MEKKYRDELDLNTLNKVLFMMSLYSDMTTRTQGYSRLKDIINEIEKERGETISNEQGNCNTEERGGICPDCGCSMVLDYAVDLACDNEDCEYEQRAK